MKKSPIWDLLDELFRKKGITEVAINGPNLIFVEKDHRFFQIDGKWEATDIFQFANDVAQLNHRIIDENHPIIDGKLPTGQRVNILHPPYTHQTPVITIRQMSNQLVRLDDQAHIFGLSVPWVHFLKSLVLAKLNVLISGGTSTGKTTLLNMFLQEIPRHQRVITLEETRELEVDLPNIVYLECPGNIEGKVLSMRDLVRNTLRMRPDRIIIGEVRGGELFDLLQAMNTGHEGSMASIHSNSPADCFTRMITLFLLSGFDVPVPTIKRQIATSIHFIIQLSKNSNGGRYISEITEITGMEGENIVSQKIGIAKNDKLTYTGIPPKTSDRLKATGLPSDFFSHLV